MWADFNCQIYKFWQIQKLYNCQWNITVLHDHQNQIRERDQFGLLLDITISWGRWNFKPYPLPYQVHCPSPQTLPKMFLSSIPIPQFLPVMTPMQKLDTLWETLTHHYVLGTHNTCQWEFLKPNSEYSCITLQVLKMMKVLESSNITT